MSPNSKVLLAPRKFSRALLPFEKKLLTRLLRARLRDQHFLVAVSGGQDSMALLSALMTISQNLSLKLTVAHVHHGPADDERQTRFRDGAFEVVRTFCVTAGLDFVGAIAATSDGLQNSSEAELRDYRYHLLRGLAERAQANYILTAHHRDDVLETRVIRLLRGVGPSGLKAISFRRGELLRPILGFWRSEIEEYVLISKTPYCEDPSNADTKFLRNWVRHNWLNDLRKKSPKFYENFAQSLLLLATQAQGLENRSDSIIVEGQMDRLLFTGLSEERKLSVLVHYIKVVGSYDYRASQIREIRKRLDTFRNDLSFNVGQLDWTVTPTRIRASRGVR